MIMMQIIIEKKKHKGAETVVPLKNLSYFWKT